MSAGLRKTRLQVQKRCVATSKDTYGQLGPAVEMPDFTAYSKHQCVERIQVQNPDAHTSDSFFFMDGVLTVHNKASFTYLDEQGEFRTAVSMEEKTTSTRTAVQAHGELQSSKAEQPEVGNRSGKPTSGRLGQGEQSEMP